MITKFYLPSLMAIIFLFTSCENSTEKNTEESESSEKREQMEESLSQIKTDLDDRISKLTGKSKEVGEDAKQQVTTAIQKLQSEREKIISLLDDVGEASDEGLKQLEKDVQDAETNLADEFQQISEESKSWFKDQMDEES